MELLLAIACLLYFKRVKRIDMTSLSAGVCTRAITPNSPS